MTTLPRPYKRGTSPVLPGQERRYQDNELRRLEQNSSQLVSSIEELETDLTAALALKADIASPTFTGDPTAPTPAAGDNDTSIATTAYVQTELADYAPINSPTFTGDPKGPTPAAGDNDTSLATTAFVQTELADYVQGPASAIDGQWVLFDSTTGKIIKAGRRVLAADLTIYVRQGGDGTGFGLVQGATAWGSWQDAIDWVDDNVWTNGFNVTFAQDTTATLPDTYSPASGTPVITITRALPGGGRRIFQGAPVNNDDVRFDATGSAQCVFVSSDQDCGAIEFVDRFQMDSEAIPIDIRAPARVRNTGVLNFVGGAPADLQISQDGGYFANDGTIILAHDCDHPFRIDSGTFHNNADINISGTRTFTYLYRGDFFSQGYISNGDATISGSFTGHRCWLKQHAVLEYSSDQPIPASTKGLVAPGAVLCQDGITENVMYGTATFSASDSASVDFSTQNLLDQFDGTYFVAFFPSDNNTFWYESRTTTGFTARAATSTSLTVSWMLSW